MRERKLAHLALRAAVAFAFLYPAIAAIFDPLSWMGYFPAFLRGYVPDMVLLQSFGALEILIALWILSGRRIFIPSALAALILAAIVLFDFHDIDVLFRDISIAGAALSLALTAYPRTRDLTVFE